DGDERAGDGGTGSDPRRRPVGAAPRGHRRRDGPAPRRPLPVPVRPGPRGPPGDRSVLTRVPPRPLVRGRPGSRPEGPALVPAVPDPRLGEGERPRGAPTGGVRRVPSAGGGAVGARRAPGPSPGPVQPPGRVVGDPVDAGGRCRPSPQGRLGGGRGGRQ